MIIDVAVTRIDGSSRRINDNLLQPLITRFAQKIQKYHRVANQHGYQFIQFVFSHNGQIHPDSLNFVRTQIDHKLSLVDGRVMPEETQFGSYRCDIYQWQLVGSLLGTFSGKLRRCQCVKLCSEESYIYWRLRKGLFIVL